MDKKTMILVTLAVIAVMNIAALALMGHDKRCARSKSRRDFKSGKSRTADGSNQGFEAQRRCQGKWRVPENRRFLVTACFGGQGGVLGIARVTAWCASDNIASKRTLEKAGMRLSGIEAGGLEVEGQRYDKLDYTFSVQESE